MTRELAGTAGVMETTLDCATRRWGTRSRTAPPEGVPADRGEKIEGVKMSEDREDNSVSQNKRVTLVGVRHNCPQCQSRDVARILRGLPAYSREMQRELDAGELTLGGCLISEGSPLCACNACGRRFGPIRRLN